MQPGAVRGASFMFRMPSMRQCRWTLCTRAVARQWFWGGLCGAANESRVLARQLLALAARRQILRNCTQMTLSGMYVRIMSKSCSAPCAKTDVPRQAATITSSSQAADRLRVAMSTLAIALRTRSMLCEDFKPVRNLESHKRLSSQPNSIKATFQLGSLRSSPGRVSRDAAVEKLGSCPCMYTQLQMSEHALYMLLERLRVHCARRLRALCAVRCASTGVRGWTEAMFAKGHRTHDGCAPERKIMSLLMAACDM